MQRNKERGVALITALIITTIAVSLAAMVMYRQQIQIRLSSNIGHLEQAYLYVNGMEDWAGTILEKTYLKHNNYDSLKDDWYAGGKLITLPIDGGVMNGQIIDLQGRINLNSLLRPIPPKQPPAKKGEPKKPQKPDIAKITRVRLTELIKQIDSTEDMGPPENFAEIVKDWIDKDEINGNIKPGGEGSGSGAESPYYQSLEPAYYSANTPMVSPTEVRLLKNINKDIYKKLLPHISTLPITLATPINLNTADKVVLKSIGFDNDAISKLLEERDKNPFESIKDATLTDLLGKLGGNFSKDDLDVKSNYFLLRGSVRINNARVFINSVLERKNGKVSVIMRDFSNP